MIKLQTKYEVPNEIPGLASGIPIFVKYLSAMLDCNFERGRNSLQSILTYHHLAAKLAASESRNTKYRKRIAICAERSQQLKKRFIAVIGVALSTEDPEISISEAKVGSPEGAVPETGLDSTPSAAATTVSYKQDIAHSYISIRTLTRNHPMVVMHNAGDSLYDLVYCPGSKYWLDFQQSQIGVLRSSPKSG